MQDCLWAHHRPEQATIADDDSDDADSDDADSDDADSDDADNDDC
jgi:hypothetical protein